MSLSLEISSKAPLIWASAAKGTQFDEVVIKVMNPTTGKTAFRYRLKPVVVTSYSEGKDSPKPASMELALRYGQIQQIAFKADGVTVAQQFCFNVALDKVCSTS